MTKEEIKLYKKYLEELKKMKEKLKKMKGDKNMIDDLLKEWKQ